MHTLPALQYEYNALEPFFDEQTMRIHHTKHHQTYIDKLNSALEKFPELQQFSVEQLLTRIDSLPASIKQAVINHGGGHANHSFFWTILKKGVKPESNHIMQTFGSIENFKKEFSQAALNRFGSGWAWLVIQKDKTLAIVTTPNQDSPIMQGQIPIIGIDVWEHAYYLKYQNRRAEYVDAFFNVLDWKFVDKLIEKAHTKHS